MVESGKGACVKSAVLTNWPLVLESLGLPSKAKDTYEYSAFLQDLMNINSLILTVPLERRQVTYPLVWVGKLRHGEVK